MRMPFVPTEGCCRVCGKAVEDLDGEYLCEDCGGRDAPAFDRAAGAVRFEGRARELVLCYKSARRLWLRDDFVDWLEAAARSRFDVSSVDIVLPMPATPVHRFLRGYNQCEYLASELARRFRRAYRSDVVARCGSPRRQAELDEASRRENVKGTFSVKKPEFVRGRTILVVDDVMTTGSTLSECARTLKAAGAWRVWCATVAQAVR
jgi:ComF family protein